MPSLLEYYDQFFWFVSILMLQVFVYFVACFCVCSSDEPLRLCSKVYEATKIGRFGKWLAIDDGS